ncbi:MAG: alpha-L-fucosidase [Acidobacteriota bacterium]
MNNEFGSRRAALRIFIVIILVLLIVGTSALALEPHAKKTTLRRSSSFFGLHFDFHAGPDSKEIGRNVTEASILEILRSVNPDFIQIDCKGHPGLSSYPTKVGNRAPGFVGDPLRLWRSVTSKEHVALYMHYSGVYDQQAIKNDSTLARVNADGRRDHDMVSVFGPYVDRIMIPQFLELNDTYHVDGVWVDGDCWATGIDYSPKSVESFKKKSGRMSLSKTAAEPGFDDLRDFSRKAYLDYLKHYVDAVHAHNPKFQIASNWAFSSFMPEPVSVNVDFLSGDYNYVGSMNSARWEGRYLQNQGKPWDLLSWSFVTNNGVQTPKTETQLMQEAAAVISLGGGFQAYITQNRDGSVTTSKIKPMVGVGKFIRERQKYCKGASPIPQVALFYSKDDFYKRIPGLYGGWGTGEYAKGVLFAMLDDQRCVQVISEHHLKGKMSRYPLIVIPEMEYLASDMKRELLDYVKKGGKLLVTGARSSGFFRDEVQTESGGEDAIVPYGKGSIGFIPEDVGTQYYKQPTDEIRDRISRSVNRLFPDQTVTVAGMHGVDVTLNRVGKKTVVNLINIGRGPDVGAAGVYSEIPPVKDVHVSYRSQKKPSKITLIPGNKKLPMSYQSGIASVIIPRVDIHSLLVIE